MKAIIRRESVTGRIAEVGTTDCTVVSHYKTLDGVRRYARKYAQGKPYRIEFFRHDNFYGEPFLVESES